MERDIRRKSLELKMVSIEGWGGMMLGTHTFYYKKYFLGFL